jgi:pimeloyl-ACP methyl ester carboxylesterase
MSVSVSIRRRFVDLAEGQVHVREAGFDAEPSGCLPLVMLHASPGSARLLQAPMLALAARRHVIATDTLGNGDSCSPLGAAPDIAYFADAHMRALSAMGLDRFDLYGTHTGANIACEIALRAPQRVRRLVLDGVSLYSAQEQAEMLALYAPAVGIDHEGSQFLRLWTFVRDAYLFWPWYRRDAVHRRAGGLPSADELHDKVVEVLKAARTYHLPYRAAIAYDKAPRLPRIEVPTLLACARSDMFMAYFDAVSALMPRATPLLTDGFGTPAALAETVRAFEAFLDQE